MNLNLEYITKSRESLGFTKLEVSRYLGVTSTVISQWEKGKTKPKADHIITLCKLLNMDANILLGLRGEIE